MLLCPNTSLNHFSIAGNRLLTDGIFETGAHGVKVVHLVSNAQSLAEHTVGAIRLTSTITGWLDGAN